MGTQLVRLAGAESTAEKIRQGHLLFFSARKINCSDITLEMILAMHTAQK